MARIRTIKPEFWTSAQVLECSTNARLLFIGLWNFADDAGRHPDSAKQVKAEVFPADDLTLADVQALLDELAEIGLIRRYTAENTGYFLITGWKHQRIDKPQKPKYPEPVAEHSKNDTGTLPPDTKGNDTKGNDKARADALPDWIPEDAWQGFVDMRKKAKAPLTERAKTLTITALDKLRAEGHDPAAVLNQSTMNGWKGVFPLKGGDNREPAKRPELREFGT